MKLLHGALHQARSMKFMVGAVKEQCKELPGSGNLLTIMNNFRKIEHQLSDLIDQGEIISRLVNQTRRRTVAFPADFFPATLLSEGC